LILKRRGGGKKKKNYSFLWIEKKGRKKEAED